MSPPSIKPICQTPCPADAKMGLILMELSGGGVDGSAQAWANYKAHEAAEKQVGK